MICSPYDTEATYGRKLTTWWVGYKVHLTESCDEDAPRLITHVETSRAGNGDVDVTPRIHQALKEKDLVPTEHLTETNDAEAKQFVQRKPEYGIDLIAPTRADHKWQAKEQRGFDESLFQIDWEAHKATCPVGRESLSWTRAVDGYDKKAHQDQVLHQRLQAVSDESALYQSATPDHLSPWKASTIRRYKQSESAKKTRHFGRNIEPDLGLKEQSHKEYERLGCAGAATVG